MILATENELKFVLKPFVDVHRVMRDLEDRYRFATIDQGYLTKCKGLTVRVRHSISSQKNRGEFRLTVKKLVNDRLIENEMLIDGRDFGDYWSQCHGKIHKIRFYMDDWEIDFFLDPEGAVYFILAEHEMPEDQEYPENFPEFVKEHLLFEVPRSDDRFSNRKLSQVEYAKELWSSLEGRLK